MYGMLANRNKCVGVERKETYEKVEEKWTLVGNSRIEREKVDKIK